MKQTENWELTDVTSEQLTGGFNHRTNSAGKKFMELKTNH